MHTRAIKLYLIFFLTLLVYSNDSQAALKYHRVLLLGDSGIGKSEILDRYLKDKLSSSTLVKDGLSIKSTKKTSSDFSFVQVEYLDIAGNDAESFLKTLKPNSIDLVILIYDITDLKSFLNLEKWLNLLFASNGTPSDILLVGNKCDLTEKRQVTYTEAHKFARDHGILFFEVSAKTTESVDFLFKWINHALNYKYSDARKAFLRKAHISFPEIMMANYIWYGNLRKGNFDEVSLNNNANGTIYIVKDFWFRGKKLYLNYTARNNRLIKMLERHERLIIDLEENEPEFIDGYFQVNFNYTYSLVINEDSAYHEFKCQVQKILHADSYRKDKLKQLVKRYLDSLKMPSHDVFDDPDSLISGFSHSETQFLENQLQSTIGDHLQNELRDFAEKMEEINEIEILEMENPHSIDEIDTKIESARAALKSVSLSILRVLNNFPEQLSSVSINQLTDFIRYVYFEYYHEDEFAQLIDHFFYDSKAYLLNDLYVKSQSSPLEKGCFYSERISSSLFLQCCKIQNDLLYLTEKIASMHQEYSFAGNTKEIAHPESGNAVNFMINGPYNDVLQRISSFAAFKILFLLKRLQASNPNWNRLLDQILSEDNTRENKILDQDFHLYGRYGLAGEVLKEVVRRERKLSDTKQLPEKNFYDGLWQYLIALAGAQNSIEGVMEEFINLPFLQSTDLLMFLLRK